MIAVPASVRLDLRFITEPFAERTAAEGRLRSATRRMPGTRSARLAGDIKVMPGLNRTSSSFDVR